MINQRVWLIVSLLLLIVVLVGMGQQPAQKPNVPFILTDDQGYGDLSLHGNPYVETPNMDAIGWAGAQFNRFYVSPLCAPSRASFLTGRYHLRTGVVSVSNGLEVMNANELTLAELLRQNGYRTGCFGKWHNGEHLPNHPNGQGFEEFFGFCAGHWTNYFDTPLEHNGRMEPTNGYITDVLTARAITFMRQHRREPFFCYVPLNAPHSPHQVPDRYFQTYKAKGLDDEKAAIYGMVENVDDNIGRLLKTLNDLNLDENTIVIFSTDNGPNGQRFNAGMKGVKGSVDEGGVRVPFFVRWPGHIKPKTIRPIAAHIDLMPTLIDLLGLKNTAEKPFDGVSLAGQLRDENPAPMPERAIFTHVAQLAKTLSNVPGAIRTEQYRWVRTRQETGLYAMRTDSLQTTNIAAAHPDLMRQFGQQYDQWFAEVSGSIDMAARPLPIGQGRKRQVLHSHEAGFSGNIRFAEGHGWAHDWLTNWQAPTDQLWWDVDNREAKTYRVAVQYTTATSGSMLRLQVGNEQVRKAIQSPHNPPQLPSPDRLPRKEAFEKVWREQPLGSIRIPKGRHRLVLDAPSVVGTAVADVKGLVLIPR
jgi:arylsulfatase A-like enzyme